MILGIHKQILKKKPISAGEMVNYANCKPFTIKFNESCGIILLRAAARDPSLTDNKLEAQYIYILGQ